MPKEVTVVAPQVPPVIVEKIPKAEKLAEVAEDKVIQETVPVVVAEEPVISAVMSEP